MTTTTLPDQIPFDVTVEDFNQSREAIDKSPIGYSCACLLATALARNLAAAVELEPIDIRVGFEGVYIANQWYTLDANALQLRKDFDYLVPRTSTTLPGFDTTRLPATCVVTRATIGPDIGATSYGYEYKPNAPLTTTTAQ